MRSKWIYFTVALLVVCTAGLVVGKLREGDYLTALYARHDFTLLDTDGNFFHLGDTPERTLVLLVFTPDLMPREASLPIYGFGRHVDDLRQRGIETALVTRLNRDIALNFQHASRYPGRVLLDPTGTVGKLAGAWQPGTEKEWSYALVDRTFRVLWFASSEQPLRYEELLTELKKAK